METEVPDVQPDGGAEEPESGDGKSKHFFNANHLKGQIRTEAMSMFSARKDRITKELENLARVLKESCEKMPQNSSMGRLTGFSAEGIERITGHLRQSEPDKIVHQVEDFARRKPAVVAGVALAAGFIIGQILSDLGRQASGKSRFVRGKMESSLEYHPAEDEEAYHERH